MNDFSNRYEEASTIVYTNRGAFRDLKLNGPATTGLEKLIKFDTKKRRSHHGEYIETDKGFTKAQKEYNANHIKNIEAAIDAIDLEDNEV
jgi:hypothetical protein